MNSKDKNYLIILFQSKKKYLKIKLHFIVILAIMIDWKGFLQILIIFSAFAEFFNHLSNS